MGIKEIIGGEVKKVFSDTFYQPEEIVQGVEDLIRPVVDMKPIRNNIIKNLTGSGTLYATPADKDFYLTGAALNGSNVAAAENANQLSITVTLPSGETQIILSHSYYTNATFGTHAEQSQIFYPILIKRGTNITSSMAGSIGKATIMGFEENSYDKNKV